MAYFKKMKPVGKAKGRAFSSPYLRWLAWVVWLPFLVPEIIQLLRTQPLPTSSLLALVAQAVFVPLYAVSSLRVARGLGGSTAAADARNVFTRTALVLCMTVLSAAIMFLGGRSNLSLIASFIYTSAYAGSAFSTPRSAATDACVLAVCLATGALAGMSPADLGQSFFLIIVVSFMTISGVRSIVTGRKLHEAQGEIAQAGRGR